MLSPRARRRGTATTTLKALIAARPEDKYAEPYLMPTPLTVAPLSTPQTHPSFNWGGVGIGGEAEVK